MKKKIPQLNASPFAPVEIVDTLNLSASDRAILEKAEAVIEAGEKTFLDVAAALIQIRDYKSGVLYKERYGTWEAYCTERWDFGRTYANRLTNAAEVYTKLLPVGNKQLPLPDNERQIRPLLKLESAALRRQAWKGAVEEAGEGPVFGRLVEKSVRTVMEEKGIARTAPPRSGPRTFRITSSDAKQIQRDLSRIRKFCAALPKSKTIVALIDTVRSRLPHNVPLPKD